MRVPKIYLEIFQSLILFLKELYQFIFIKDKNDLSITFKIFPVKLKSYIIGPSSYLELFHQSLKV